jgi:hypothetical protein
LAKKPTSDVHEANDEAVTMERMNEALKRMMNTAPETHKEMVERRQSADRAPKTRRRGKPVS